MPQLSYTTRSGIHVTRTLSKPPFKKGFAHILRELDRYRGFYLSSGYEYPGRYSRWDIASVRPLIEVVAAGRVVEFRPLNLRGQVFNKMLLDVLAPHPHWESIGIEAGAVVGRLLPCPTCSPKKSAASGRTLSVLHPARPDRGVPEREGPVASRWSAHSDTTSFP